MLAADFQQIVTNPMTGSPDTSWGKLYQLPPNRLGMRFTQPRGDRIVADGRFFWLYTPSTTPGQVIRTRIPASGGQGPNLIGQFADRPHERYRARYVRGDSLGGAAVDVVNLVPRDTSDATFSEATLWVDRSDGLPRRIEFQETSGQKRTITLSKVALNGEIPWREFTFTVPATVQVVDQ
jgi:outer membrane lipoprotein carrier protein